MGRLFKKRRPKFTISILSPFEEAVSLVLMTHRINEGTVGLTTVQIFEALRDEGWERCDEDVPLSLDGLRETLVRLERLGSLRRNPKLRREPDGDLWEPNRPWIWLAPTKEGSGIQLIVGDVVSYRVRDRVEKYLSQEMEPDYDTKLFPLCSPRWCGLPRHFNGVLFEVPSSMEREHIRMSLKDAFSDERSPGYFHLVAKELLGQGYNLRMDEIIGSRW